MRAVTRCRLPRKRVYTLSRALYNFVLSLHRFRWCPPRQIITEAGLSYKGLVEKPEFIALAKEALTTLAGEPSLPQVPNR